MTMFKRILLLGAAAALILSGLIAGAAPLKRADVIADPGFVLHIDFDGLRGTSVGKAILADLQDPDIDSKLQAIQGIFSFDPRTQLHGATIYSTSRNPPEGALIVYAEFDSNRVVALGNFAHGYETITNGSYIIHTWIDDKAKTNDEDGAHIFASIKDNRIILSKSEFSLVTALDVLSGKAPNLGSTKDLPELGNAGKGNVVQAIVHKFEFDDKGPNAAIFKMSKIVHFELGETDDKMAAALSFEAKDADTATQISAIAQGLIALLKLQQDNADLLKIANAVSIHQDGAVVTANASMAVKDMNAMIKHHVEAAEKEDAGDTNKPEKSTEK
jgi:hypothetical protein